MILWTKNKITIHAQQGMVDDKVFAYMFSIYDKGIEDLEKELQGYEREDYGNKILFIAYDGERPIGLLSAYKKNKYFAAESHWFVEPEYRNKGVGLQLFKWFKIWGSRVGCTKYIYRKNNEPVIKEYKRGL